MLFTTPSQFAALVLALVAGWLFGLASHPGGRKWRERYAAERDAHALTRKEADARIAEANARAEQAERLHDTTARTEADDRVVAAERRATEAERRVEDAERRADEAERAHMRVIQAPPEPPTPIAPQPAPNVQVIRSSRARAADDGDRKRGWFDFD